MSTLANSIGGRIERGEVSCKECSVLATEPVVGWFFASNGSSYCPEHPPLGVGLDFSTASEGQ